MQIALTGGSVHFRNPSCGIEHDVSLQKLKENTGGSGRDRLLLKWWSGGFSPLLLRLV
jgi:hypothetical protein